MASFGSCDQVRRGAICLRTPDLLRLAMIASFAGDKLASRIMNGLATAHDASMQMIDTSVVRVHQH